MSAQPKQYPGLFHAYTERKGKDWLKKVEPVDRQAFCFIGMRAHDFGRLGGKARARTGKRDRRGRFVKEDSQQ